MQIEVFESAPSALNQLVRVRGDGAQPGGRATGGPARAHARGPGGRTGGCGRTGARAWAAGELVAQFSGRSCSRALLLLLTAQNCVKNVYSSNPVYDYSTRS